MRRSDGLRCPFGAKAHEALEALNQERIDVMITDQRMPSMTGINLVRKTKETHPEVVKMILTGFRGSRRGARGVE